MIFLEDDYNKFDLIVAMDSENVYNLNRMFSDSENKIKLLLSFTGANKEVADPWYTRDFNKTWNDVNLGCKKLLEYIKQEML